MKQHCVLLLTLLLSASIYYVRCLPGQAHHDPSLDQKPDFTHASTNAGDRQIIEQYLIDYGYLDSSTYNNYEFRRALRQFQRENNLSPINGKINPEIIIIINEKREVQMVIEYLKRYNYIQDYDRRWRIPNAVKWLQKNSGELNVTGVIDPSTINFVKTHQLGFTEPIMLQ